MEIYRSEVTLLPTKFGAFNVKVYAQNREDKRHYKKRASRPYLPKILINSITLLSGYIRSA